MRYAFFHHRRETHNAKLQKRHPRRTDNPGAAAAGVRFALRRKRLLGLCSDRADSGRLFVIDYRAWLPYLRGIPMETHAALVLCEPNGSPNVGDDLACANSQHEDQADFTNWWLNR